MVTLRDTQLLLLTVTLLIYCIVVIMAEVRKNRLASPVALFSGLYLVHFCVPALALAIDSGYSFANVENEEYVLEAVLFLMAVLLSFNAGVWFITSATGPQQHVPITNPARNWDSTSVLVVCIVLNLIGWVTRAHVIEQDAYFQFARAIQGNLEGPLHAAIRTAELFPLHVVFILTIHVSNPEHSSKRAWKLLLAMMMGMELAYWLPTGRKEETIQIFLIPMLIRYLRTHSLPSISNAILLLSFILILFPAAYYYRVVLQQIVVTNSDVLEAVPTAISALEAGAGSDPDLTASEILLHRLDLLEPVSASVRLVTLGDWPLELGRSYAMALLAAFPRLIWSSKPDLHYGTEFGHAAGLLYIDDWITSISVTFPGEGFLNFGWLGFIPFLPLGAAYGVLHKASRDSHWVQTATLMYAICLPTILYIGGTFSLYIGGLLKLLPLYGFLGWLMSQRIPGPAIPTIEGEIKSCVDS